MYPVKKHPSISIADQGTLLKFLPRTRNSISEANRMPGGAAACLASLSAPPVRRRITKSPIPPTMPPASYYNSATGTGTTLRSQSAQHHLHRLHQRQLWRFPLHPADSVGGSERLVQNDSDLQQRNRSLSPTPVGPTRRAFPGWDGGTTWNREHLWPQSILGVSVSNSYTGPASDLFELAPCNPSINSSRGNNDYGTTDASGTYFNHGTNPHPFYFFPGDAQKGDVARSIFYMATRYYRRHRVDSITLNVVDGFPNDTTITPITLGDRQSLLRWNYADGVNNFERRKNDLIYDNYQHNRNPLHRSSRIRLGRSSAIAPTTLKSPSPRPPPMAPRPPRSIWAT